MFDIISECKRISQHAGCVFAVEGADKLTTFKGGGSACVFYPENEDEFAEVYIRLSSEILPPYVLGGGSDTIIADGLCMAPIISTKRLNGIEVKDKKAYVGSGAYLRDVTRAFRKSGVGGFEFLSGVPLTVGGAVRMNASAFATETADYVDEIRVLKPSFAYNGKSDICTLKRNEVDFAYRSGVSDVILGAVLKADDVDAETSLRKTREYAARRALKQPKYPSCGSVFKNGDVPSGKLIEECGLKGARFGGAQISELHGNFIINIGGATAADFMSLVRLAEDGVYKKFGINLQREFVYLGS